MGLEGEGQGAQPLGGCWHGVSCPWIPETGWVGVQAQALPWGPLQAPPQPRPVVQCTQAASLPNTPDLAHPEGQ